MNELNISAELSLPLDAVTETFSFLAKRGAGKTFAAKVMAEEMLKAGAQVIVLDCLDVWWGLRSSPDGKGKGLPIAIFGGEHGDIPLEPTAGAYMADLLVTEGLSAILVVEGFSKNDQRRFATDFAERLFRRNREPLHLILEEADRWAPQRPMKGEERMLGAFEEIVRRGRSKGIGATLITQRSAVINKDVLSVASWMRAPIWQGWRGRSLRSMEQIWTQAARYRPVLVGPGFEYIELPAKTNQIKTLCFKSGMGWWAPVVRVIRHQYRGPMIRLAQKWGEIVVTPNHSVYNSAGALSMPQDNPELLAVRRINQQHTRDRDRVTLAAPDSHFVLEDGWLRAKDRRGRRTRSRLLRELKGEDLFAFCRFLGAFISEGSVHQNRSKLGVSWTIQIGNQDRPWLEAIAADIALFTSEASVHINDSSTPGMFNLSMSHMALGKWLAKHCGHWAAGKRLPDFVFNLTKPYAVALLNHLNDGDGHWFETGRWIYSTLSTELAQGVGFLCSLHDLDYSVSYDRNTGVYHILQCEWYNNRDAEVRQMETVPYDGWVYDLEIDDRYCHNFAIGVGNVVVHNTQSEVLVAMRTPSKHDRKAIEDWFDAHEADQVTEVMKTVPSLGTGDAWISSPYWLGILKRVHFRMAETFDSSSTPKVGEVRRQARTFADVDLAAIKEQMSETIERVKADDPKELRRHIGELERELRVAQRATADPVIEKIEVEVVKEIQVPVLDESLVLRLEAAMEPVAGVLEEVQERLTWESTLHEEVIEYTRKLRDRREDLPRARRAGDDPGPVGQHRRGESEGADLPARRDAGDEHQRRAQRVDPAPGRQSGGEAVPGAEEDGLGKCPLAILTAVASQDGGMPMRRAAMIAGYSPKKSTVRNALSTLRSRGLIATEGSMLRVTDAGLCWVANAPALPTGPALFSYWMSELGAAERAMLQLAVDEHPRSVTKDDIGHHTEYDPSKSTIRNAFSKLRTLGLVEGMRATDDFMDSIGR